MFAVVAHQVRDSLEATRISYYPEVLVIPS